MILQRYLLKDIFSYTAAVSLVFLFVILSSRSIQYLEQVSRGELSSEIVFWIILFRLPEFLEIILPFSFFISMVLLIGRLSSENEMIVLEQNGYSGFSFLKLFLSCSLVIALFVSVLSFWITPSFKTNLNNIYLETTFKDDFNSIQPGKFVFLENKSVFYAEEKKGGELSSVFLRLPDEGSTNSSSFLTAKKSFVSEENPNLLYFEQGFTITKNQNIFVEMQFDLFSMNIEEDFLLNKKTGFDDMTESNSSLSDKLSKLSLPLLSVIATVMALPLSRVKPRKGRYSRVLPSMLVFMIYLALLLLIKGWAEEGSIYFQPSLLLVHLFFLFLGIMLFRYSSLKV